MTTLLDAFPLLVVGVTFTAVGALKVYGRMRGIVGGGGQPLKYRMLGSCPTWSRHVNLAMTWLFCVIGVAALGASAVTFFQR